MEGVQIWASVSYQPEQVVTRFARWRGGQFYRVHEINAQNRTIREVDVRGCDLPEGFAATVYAARYDTCPALKVPA